MPRLASPLRTIRVALLICGELTPKLVADHGNMFSVYQRWLKNSLPPYSGVRLVMHGYDAAGTRYPTESQLPKYDAIMLTGSPSDAWVDEPWIKRLVTFVRHVGDEHPRIKIYGICFGHQIVNRALGGIAQRNTNGWELGPTIVHTTDIGKMLFGVDKLVRHTHSSRLTVSHMYSPKQKLQQVHQDHVPLSSLSSLSFSGKIYSLGFTDNTDNHGLVKFHPETPDFSNYPTSRLSRYIHVMTIQGHPEFHDTITADIARELHGVNPNFWETNKQHGPGAERSASEIHETQSDMSGTKDDGVDIVGKAFWRMFGIEGGSPKRRLFPS